MTDFGKIKKNRFGDVPGEPSGNLKAKENPEQHQAKAERTEPLNFKVSPAFIRKAFRQAAYGLKLVELLEVCFEQRKASKND